MSNLFKKIFVSFAVLSVVLWSSGISAFAKETNDNEQDSSSPKINICHMGDHDSDDDDKDHSHDNHWQAIRVSVNGWDGHSSHPSDYVYAGPIKENGKPDNEDHMADLWCLNNAPADEEPVEVVHGEWCSALLGIVESTMDNNAVIDLNGDGTVDLNDNISPWYTNGDNTACRARFDGTFDQSNYLNIDWCAGLKQGVTDTMGAKVGDAKYSTIFDLKPDGVINLSDMPILASLVTVGDQAACYAYYVPPMPEWPVEPVAICGDGQINNDNEQCDDGNIVSGDGCSATCQLETPEPPVATRSQWCSALKGIFMSTMDDNAVIDLDNNPADALSDIPLMSNWYENHNDTACYNRFDLGDGVYNFNQDNYQNIDWCAGLKQGIMDYMGTSTTTPEFSTIFDLNHDGVINLSDTPILSGLVTAGDQAACYAYYVPPMPNWQNNPEICESVDHALTHNQYPTCGAATCEEGYDAVDGVCVANDAPSCTNTVEHATSYGSYPTCNVTACESGYVLTGGSCVAEQRSYGGGGGTIPLNIFNVKNSLTGNSANITWETNRQSLTWMLYGTSTSYGSEYQNTSYDLTHSLALSDLLPGTTYHYQIRAKDSGNNSTYDIDRTFTTLGTLPQVLGIKENACVPDVDGDIKGVMQFIAGSLIRGCGPEVYHVLGNNVYHIPSWQYLHDNYFAQRIYNVTDEVIAQYGQTMVDDTSIRGNGAKKVAGAKLYPDGTLLKASDGKIYVVINGKKVHIMSLEELKKYAGHKMYKVSDEVLNQY